MDYSESPSPRHAHTLLLCSIFVFLSTNATFSSAQPGNNRSEADRQALLCFKSGISADPQGVLRSWRTDSLSFCSWRGVSCSSSVPFRVVSLDLSSVQLQGRLHSCVANLTSLVRLDLSGNDISGSIPEEIAALPGLQTLVLAGNNLAGSIPLSLGAAASLRIVNLAGNNLSGAIPDSLTKAPLLRVLSLSRNFLAGKIPGTLFNKSSNLVTVNLQWNHFQGAIPYWK